MNKLKIYLDNCCFNRPYDDQRFLSIFIETQAKLFIQESVNNLEVDLIWSFILDYENSFNPDESVKHEIFLWREKASCYIMNDKRIIDKAQKFVQSGFGKKDAIHLASAIYAGSDYFITVDKGILKKKALVDEISIISPIEFVTRREEINNEI